MDHVPFGEDLALLTFYGRSSSDSVRKVLWMLGETGQSFEHVQRGGSFGGLDDPEYLKLNPHGRIPTLCDDDVVVWESNAIIRYLAARYFSGTMWPEDPARRSYADQWMEWAQTRLYPDFNKLLWLTVRTPQAELDLSDIRDTSARLSGSYRILDTQLKQHDYIAGSDLTMGDFPSVQRSIATLRCRFSGRTTQRHKVV